MQKKIWMIGCGCILIVVLGLLGTAIVGSVFVISSKPAATPQSPSSGLAPDAVASAETPMPPDPPLDLPKNPLDEDLPAPRAAALARAALAKIPTATPQDKASLLAIALEYAGQAVEAQPQEAIYHLLMTEVCLSGPKNTLLITLAEHHIGEAMKLMPQDLDIRLAYAKTKALAQMYDAALTQFEAIAQSNPERLTPDTVAIMTDCYVLDQRTIRGCTFYARLLTQNPRAYTVRLAYAILLHQDSNNKQHALIEIRSTRLLGSPPEEIKQYASLLEARWMKEE